MKMTLCVFVECRNNFPVTQSYNTIPSQYCMNMKSHTNIDVHHMLTHADLPLDLQKKRVSTDHFFVAHSNYLTDVCVEASA